MVINLILFLLGLFLLVKGSGIFVKSAASIAHRLKVPEFIIGLTLIALGTSLPELVSSVIASINLQSTLIIGTIIGANIANLSLVFGLSSLIHPIRIKENILKRDGYMLFFVIVLLGVMSYDKVISRTEGIVLLLIFLAYNMFLIESIKKVRGNYNFQEFTKYFFRFGYLSSLRDGVFLKLDPHYNKKNKKKIYNIKKHIFKNFLFLMIGGSLIYLGAKFVVYNAVEFANYLNASLFIIGVLVSIGTTLPEMSVSVASSRKKLGNIAAGNALGSCITNILLIIGISAIISPINFVSDTIYYALGFLFLLNIVVLIYIRTGYQIRRIEGISLIFIYILFLILLLLGIL